MTAARALPEPGGADGGERRAGPARTGRGREAAAGGTRLGTIARVLEVLEALGEHPEGSRLAELVRHTGLPKSTLHRTLAEMREIGLLRRAGHRYWLSDQVPRLAGGRESQRAGRIRELVLPYLLEAYEQTHEAVHLTVLRGLDAVCVDRLHGARSSAVRFAVGQAVPADGCAAGQVLLAYPSASVRGMLAAGGLAGQAPATSRPGGPGPSPARRRGLAGDAAGGRGCGRERGLTQHLDVVRRRGLAVDPGGQYPGVFVAAAPVLDQRGLAVAAVSVMGAVGAIEPHLLARVAAAAARQASAAVRPRPGPDCPAPTRRP